MADINDVRQIALSLPGVEEGAGMGGNQTAFSVPGKQRKGGFAWVWMERVEPKKPRVPNEKVIAIRTRSLEDKETWIATDPEKFFTEPHYNGYPAVLVRLANIDPVELEEVLTEGWRCQAPKELLKDFDSKTKAP